MLDIISRQRDAFLLNYIRMLQGRYFVWVVVIFGEERERERGRRRWSFVGGIVERGLTDETKECFDSGTVSFDGYTIIVPVRETWSFRDRISGAEHRYIGEACGFRVIGF